MNIEQQIKQKEQELGLLKKEKERLDSLLPEQKLADAIHELCCRWNHIDGCDYLYNSWENPGYNRKEYLTKAINVLKIESDFEKLIKIFTAAKL